MPIKRLHVIGCGVMEIDMAAAAAELGLTVTTEYLEAGLHNQPAELRRHLQDAVDRATGCDRIAIAYGLCGRGLVGIRAGAVPLAVPRVHDCISLFLGSDRAYRQQFANCPGTFYISAGWFEKKIQPRGSSAKTEVAGPLPAPDLARLQAKYGDENGQAIAHFLTSWKRNYSRVVFIDTGTGDRDKYETYARAMAEEYGWRFERIEGNFDLLRHLLQAEASTDDILIVPPGQAIAWDPTAGRLIAAAPRPKSAQAADQPAEGEKPSPSGGQPAKRGKVSASGGTPAPAVPTPPPHSTRLGLGIDAGGTYTDTVIYDFHHNRVLAKAKALTTRWDYTIGIGEALDQLDSSLFPHVDLVAVSTTLATNAIVEGQGQKVGLLLMPPGAGFSPADIRHRPAVVIQGRLDISGREVAPIDPDEIRRLAGKLRDEQQVDVFAVSGYASTRNPDHELAVKAILQELGDVQVICGHELSDQLNFLVRANTAALNARIIPLLTAFVDDVRRSLADRGFEARIVMVKGDGSLMSTDLARQRPIETVLSGPAASVAGARFLTGLPDATVLDMGGTTSDLARVRVGRVGVKTEGSRVGHWQTHVRALDMQTIGLGGDSAILRRKLELTIGPQRIAPISWLAARHPVDAILDRLELKLGEYLVDTRPMQIMLATDHRNRLTLTPEEQHVLAALADGPLSLIQLAEKAGIPHWTMLPLDRLENHFLVQRCGLTPTDLLHVTGDLALWEPAAARRLASMMAILQKTGLDEYIELVMERIVRELTAQLLKRQLAAGIDPDLMDDCAVCQSILDRLGITGADGFEASIRLQHPVIGLGAPVGFFLPAAAERLNAEIVIPPHADVANAVGAITSWVTVRREIRIEPGEEGGFVVRGVPGLPVFEELDTAHSTATEHLERDLRLLARQAGTSHQEVELRVHDRIVPTADGAELFLERVIHAEISGPPDAIERIAAAS